MFPDCPVFDRLQYAKTRRGRPGPFYHMNEVSVSLGRQRGEGSPIGDYDYNLMRTIYTRGLAVHLATQLLLRST